MLFSVSLRKEQEKNKLALKGRRPLESRNCIPNSFSKCVGSYEWNLDALPERFAFFNRRILWRITVLCCIKKKETKKKEKEKRNRFRKQAKTCANGSVNTIDLVGRKK